jgi:CheY-like chemotaxis protein
LSEIERPESSKSMFHTGEERRMRQISGNTGQLGTNPSFRAAHRNVAGRLDEHLHLRSCLNTLARFAGALRPWRVPTQSGLRAHVLIIEDEAPLRDLVTDALEEAGYSIEAASSVEEAERRMQEDQPQLIILDLRLPGRSGWDFLRQRHDNSRLSAIPVLVVSSAPEDRLLEAKELGADAFLSKPFDLDILSAVVRGYAH